MFEGLWMADGFFRRAGSHGSTAGKDARRYGRSAAQHHGKGRARGGWDRKLDKASRLK
jgi:hypothetical protein